MKKMFCVIIGLVLSTLYAISPPMNSIYMNDASIVVKYKRMIYQTELDKWIDHLYLMESAKNWKITNKLGFIGGWQFGKETLRQFGYHYVTLEKFKQNPYIFPEETQKKLLMSLLNFNDRLLKPYYIYIGKEINGITITKSGLLAASHLAGIYNVQKYLLTSFNSIEIEGYKLDIEVYRKRNYNVKDCFGTSIETYLREFQSFNL